MNDYNLRKSKIKGIVGETKEIISLSKCKLYTANISGEWLYTNLEGILAYEYDYFDKNKYLVLYDSENYQKLFSFLLYKKFVNFYSALTKYFHCLETNKGFIGFEYEDEDEAINFNSSLKIFDETKLKKLKKEKTRFFFEKLKIIKSNLIDQLTFEMNSSFSFDSDNGMTIFKPTYYDLLMLLEYNGDTNVFEIRNINGYYKRYFKDIGILKKDFKNPKLLLNIYRKIIEACDSLQSKKSLETDNLRTMINKNKEKIVYRLDSLETEPLQSRMSTLIDMTKIKQNFFGKDNNPFLKQHEPRKSNIPVAPRLNIPVAPKLPINQPSPVKSLDKSDVVSTKSEEETQLKKTFSTIINNGSNYLEDIKKGGIQLKKINLEEKPANTIKLNSTQENILQTSLVEAIKQRRMEITKNDLDEEESDSDSSWSD